jgi:hypothetical protein
MNVECQRRGKASIGRRNSSPGLAFGATNRFDMLRVAPENRTAINHRVGSPAGGNVRPEKQLTELGVSNESGGLKALRQGRCLGGFPHSRVANLF